MANNDSFKWEIIDEEHLIIEVAPYFPKVNRIKFQIFRRNNPVSVSDIERNGELRILATDGQKTKSYGLPQIEDFTFVVLLKGIHTRNYPYPSTKKYSFLYIEVFLSDNFTEFNKEIENDFYSVKATLTDFDYKSYVIEAIQAESIHQLSKRIKTVGSDDDKIYDLVKTPAKTYNIAAVEQVFKDYQIPDKYQALFWKEMYQATKNSN